MGAVVTEGGLDDDQMNDQPDAQMDAQMDDPLTEDVEDDDAVEYGLDNDDRFPDEDLEDADERPDFDEVMLDHRVGEVEWAAMDDERQREWLQEMSEAVSGSDAAQYTKDQAQHCVELFGHLEEAGDESTLEYKQTASLLHHEMRALGCFVGGPEPVGEVEPVDDADDDDAAEDESLDGSVVDAGDEVLDPLIGLVPELVTDHSPESGSLMSTGDLEALGDVPPEAGVLDEDEEESGLDDDAAEAVDDVPEVVDDVPDEVNDHALSFGEQTVDEVAENATLIDQLLGVADDAVQAGADVVEDLVPAADEVAKALEEAATGSRRS